MIEREREQHFEGLVKFTFPTIVRKIAMIYINHFKVYKGKRKPALREVK